MEQMQIEIKNENEETEGEMKTHNTHAREHKDMIRTT
jgi:hypothetical protein